VKATSGRPGAGRILDVGCGPVKESGAFGVDRINLPGVDLVCDLNGSWPLADGTFDRVVFRHSIVHLASLEHALREARRVVRQGGLVEIISPHFSSDNAFTDPTMRFSTGWRTMDYYCANGSMIYGYYGRLGLLIRDRRIYIYRAEPKTALQRIFSMLVWPVEVLVNAMPRIYEKFLCFVVRGNEIRYVLEAV
jgi:SAM-dependent methyltransferase